MLLSSFVVLNGFLKKFPPAIQTSLFESLSSQAKQELETAHLPLIDINLKKFCTYHLLDEVHYSWFIPFFEKLSSTEKTYFLQILNPHIRAKLCSHFSIDTTYISLSSAVKSFLKNKTAVSIYDDPNLLPRDYLPDSELNILLDLTKKELLELLTYLSLFDLAVQMKKIVDPKIIRIIQENLTEDTYKFLLSKRHYSEPFSFLPLNLKNIVERSDFFLLLHKRAILRLAKALSDENTSLIWYVAHRLDIGRGSALINLTLKKAPPEIIKTVTSNIMEVMPIIRKKRDNL